MDQTNLLYVMVGAICVSAGALLVQAFLLLGMYRVTRSTQERLNEVIPKVEGVLDASKVVIEESRAGIAEIREKSNRLLDGGQKQMEQLQTLLGEASERTRRQLDHAELLVEDTMARVEETVALVHKGVMKPIRNVTGLAAGIGTAVRFMMRGSKANPDRVTMDEEMFI